MDYKSKVHLEDLGRMFEAGFAASRKFLALAQERLRSYSQRAVELNRKVHAH